MFFTSNTAHHQPNLWVNYLFYACSFEIYLFRAIYYKQALDKTYNFIVEYLMALLKFYLNKLCLILTK